jgi:predicted nuclease of predicted toxin-antitoxin system
MRFLVDNSVSWRLAQRLRQDGHDAVHVREIALRDARDEEIYLRSATEARILITQVVDFGHLLVQSSEPKGTVVLFRLSDGRVDVQFSRLANIIARFQDELVDRQRRFSG